MSQIEKEALVAHPNARLLPCGRLLLVERVLEDGWTVLAAAQAAGVSRTTVYRWIARFRAEGTVGLVDRSSAPRRRPGALPRREVERILRARRRFKHGPHRLAWELGRARSTIYDVLRREGMSRLKDFDRPTGLRIRRSIPTDHCGERMHVDVKKLGRIPAGGGHRMLGVQAGLANSRRHGKNRGGVGVDYLHSMVDAHSRVAYTEILGDEKGSTCAAFVLRAARSFTSLGVPIEEVMTDEHLSYRRSRDFAEALAVIGARHRTTGPYRPRINGKVERFHRTLNDEWAYIRLYTSNAARSRALPRFLDRYNRRRPHAALGGLTPMQVLANNVGGKLS
jgi:transposase InsO family protein